MSLHVEVDDERGGAKAQRTGTACQLNCPAAAAASHDVLIAAAEASISSGQ